jgi:hypothetical protein
MVMSGFVEMSEGLRNELWREALLRSKALYDAFLTDGWKPDWKSVDLDIEALVHCCELLQLQVDCDDEEE